MKKIILILLFCLFAIPSYATDYYIATDGSDGGTGAIDDPWATLLKGHDNMSAGDTLNCRGGTYGYETTIFWTLSGTEGFPVTIKAFSGEVPVFDGGASGWSMNMIALRGADWVTFDGLHVTEYRSALTIRATDVVPEPGDIAEGIIIKNCYFYNNSSHGVYIDAGVVDIQIYSNVIEDCGGHASGGHTAESGKWALHFFKAPGVNGAEVYNNIFLDNDCGNSDCDPGGGGILLSADATDVNVYNNTFYANYMGLRDSGGVINFNLKNNIIYSLNAPTNFMGFYVSDAGQDMAEITTDHNLWYRPNGADFIDIKGDTYNLAEYRAATDDGDNSIEDDPDVVTLGLTRDTSDFSLQSVSPCRDEGVTAGAPATDYAGISRPQNSVFDIGAYEFVLTDPGGISRDIVFEIIINIVIDIVR